MMINFKNKITVFVLFLFKGVFVIQSVATMILMRVLVYCSVLWVRIHCCVVVCVKAPL